MRQGIQNVLEHESMVQKPSAPFLSCPQHQRAIGGDTKETASVPKGGSPVSAPVVQAPAAQASCTSGFPDSKEVKLEQIAEESSSIIRVSLQPQPHTHTETRGRPTRWPLKGKVASGGAPPPWAGSTQALRMPAS